MNMTTFTDQQLAVMAEESSPRGLSARKEIERRSKQQNGVPQAHVQEDAEQEKPKRNTRRKRNNKQEETE